MFSETRDIQVADHTNALTLPSRVAGSTGRPCQETTEIRQHPPGCSLVPAPSHLDHLFISLLRPCFVERCSLPVGVLHQAV
jgi:hypothetical protein